MDKRAIYTVITGGYDTLKEPFMKSEGWDYICFTDDPGLTSTTWEVRQVEAEPNAQRLQRRIKIMAHEYLPEYRYTIYIDGSTRQLLDFNMLIREIGYAGGMVLKKHAKRHCVYEEIAACVKLNKDARKILMEQMDNYQNKWKYPSNNGLYETGILIRENCPLVNNLCEHWYSELCLYSVRDQVSLPFALWNAGINPRVVEYSVMQKYISIQPHVRSYSLKPHIWYLQPFASDKNIGREYNHQCELIPENDWICITDHDVCFLYPETKKQIEEIVISQGAAWDLLGAVTNRIASPHQCYGGEFSEDPDILHHYEKAKDAHLQNYGIVELTLKGIAGFLMLMPKRTWDKLKFAENQIHFDTDFSRRLLQRGGKIGVMKGVYLFHYYRFHAENPKQFKDHLI